MGKFRIKDAYLHLQGQYLFLCEKIQKNSNATAFSSKKSHMAALSDPEQPRDDRSTFLTKNSRISTLLIEGIEWKLLKI